MREPAKTFEDLQVMAEGALVRACGFSSQFRYSSEIKLLLQEVSKLLEAYSRGILNPDS